MPTTSPNTILHGDALARLRELPDGCIQCCVTSPPYFGLRSYLPGGHPDKTVEIGLEETPDAYIQKLVEVFREVRRVLKENGTLWVNIGDSYAAGKAGRTDYGTGDPTSTLGPQRNGLPNNSRPGPVIQRSAPAGYKSKDLLGIPWMLAFALRADGWYLRSDVIWHKPNCMPESVKDRPTKSHEYLFLLSKSERYYYDAQAILEPLAYPEQLYSSSGKSRDNSREQTAIDTGRHDGFTRPFRNAGSPLGRNKRSVWSIPTKPFSARSLGMDITDHFAVMPEALVEPCILAGSQPGDIVLDPFSGAGTVCLVAAKHGRSYLGIELNAEYIQLANTRLSKALGMWQEEVAV